MSGSVNILFIASAVCMAMRSKAEIVAGKVRHNTASTMCCGRQNGEGDDSVGTDSTRLGALEAAEATGCV